MSEKSNVLGYVSIILSIIALVGVIALNKPAVITPTSPAINVYGANLTTPMPNTLSVTGESQLSVAPDQAIVYLDVITEGKTAKQAQDKNKEIANKVINAIEQTGITGDNIETSSYNLQKKTEWDQKTEKYVDRGYELTHTLKVTTTNLEDLGKLVDDSVNVGVTEVNSISFGLTKKTEKQVKDQALTKAAEAAKEKAQNMAGILGVKLVKITSVYENTYYYPSYSYPNYRNVMGEMAAETSTISPQKVEVTGSVSLGYEIE